MSDEYLANSSMFEVAQVMLFEEAIGKRINNLVVVDILPSS